MSFAEKGQGIISLITMIYTTSLMTVLKKYDILPIKKAIQILFEKGKA